MNLKEWENHCREKIASIRPDAGCRAGSLLRCVPERGECESLQQAVKESWSLSGNYFAGYPHTLIMLYKGLAFHEYEDNTFWPQFCRAVGVSHLPMNHQSDINESFACAAQFAGLTILEKSGHRSFVG